MRINLPHKNLLGFLAIEKDPPDIRMVFEKTNKIIGYDTVAFNIAVKAATASTLLQHIP